MVNTGWEGFSRLDLERLASPRMIERGLFDHQQGKLVMALRTGRVMAGRIAGNTTLYRTQLYLNGKLVDGKCSCPYEGFCKHMVVLALGWLELPWRFVNMQPELTKMLHQSSKLVEDFGKLAEKDLLNFWEVFCEKAVQPEHFIHNRKLLNLVRNLFRYPVLTKADAEVLWQRLTRVLQHLRRRLPEGDPEVLDCLMAMFAGVCRKYEGYPDAELGEYLVDLLDLLRVVPVDYSGTGFRGVVREMLKVYLSPAFWEISGELRRILLDCITREPLVCHREIGEFLARNSVMPTLGLIALYELWLVLPLAIKEVFGDQYQRTEVELLQNETGRLWLIDRLLELKDPRVQTLIIKLMKEADRENKDVYRERLIRLCQNNGEFEHAAALGYVQFSKAPNFEEYLRMKTISAKNSLGMWQRYYSRMQKLLDKRGLIEIQIRLAVDVGDLKLLTQLQNRIGKDGQLLKILTTSLVANRSLMLLPCYSWVCRTLLENKDFRSWNRAGVLLAAYRRLCFTEHQVNHWEDFIGEIFRHYGSWPGFVVKFGSLRGMAEDALE